MAIRMYVEYSVIISTLVSHNRVEIDLGKRALQLLEDHTRFMKRFYGNRTDLSSQASPNFYVVLRLIRASRLIYANYSELVVSTPFSAVGSL
jgi:hypothetical protein